ncbi:MAG: CFI-box-CTERM domain-containing protein [Lachnospiraceae bacterium]
MGLITAKCTQCGTNISVDSANEASICDHCGAAFITEKAINNYNTYITNHNDYSGANVVINKNPFANYLTLSASAYDAENGQEAMEYANKALELEPDSYEAWISKMKATEYLGTLSDPRIEEFYTYGNKALSIVKEDDRKCAEADIYQYYLLRCVNLLLLMITYIENTADLEQFKERNKYNLNLSKVDITNALSDSDTPYRDSITNVVKTVVNLKLQIPTDYILENDDIQDSLTDIADLYKAFWSSYLDRLKLCGQYMPPDAIEACEFFLGQLLEGVSEDKKADINLDELKTSSKAIQDSGGGCYIATCVYGSYNCPPVWTLRRFRDDILDTTWYGSLFIKLYYSISPTLVKLFGNSNWFKLVWKFILDKLILKLNNIGIENSSYYDK